MTKEYNYQKLVDTLKADIIEFEAIYEQLCKLSLLSIKTKVFLGSDFKNGIVEAKKSITSKMSEAKYFVDNPEYLKEYVDHSLAQENREMGDDDNSDKISLH